MNPQENHSADSDPVDLAPLSDDELFARSRTGDWAAFTTLHERHTGVPAPRAPKPSPVLHHLAEATPAEEQEGWLYRAAPNRTLDLSQAACLAARHSRPAGSRAVNERFAGAAVAASA